MPKKFLRRVLPDRTTIERFPITRRFSRKFDLPFLWQVQRETIAFGLAIGLFCGMIPGPLQMIAAIGMSIVFRVNLPMAIIGTFFTNPFTIIPLYMLAYGIGQSMMGDDHWRHLPSLPVVDWSSPVLAVQTWASWITELGTPWLLGMFVLAFELAAIGYFGVNIFWRVCHYFAIRRQQRRRRSRSMLLGASSVKL
jgi:uncharacterized protein (DUF2062 family)